MELHRVMHLVKEREPLWNMSHPLYNNRNCNQKLWKEIVDILGLEEHIIKNKWRNMRTCFKRELRRIANRKMAYVSKWKYMDGMMFLKDNIKPIKIEDSDSAEPQASYEEIYHHKEESQDFSDGSQEYSVSNPLEEQESLLIPMTSQNITIKEPININAPADYEKIIDEIISNTEDNSIKNVEEIDEDYYFAMSIVPSMQLLPHHRKLYVRTKIQEFLYNEHANQKPQSSLTMFTYE